MLKVFITSLQDATGMLFSTEIGGGPGVCGEGRQCVCVCVVCVCMGCVCVSVCVCMCVCQCVCEGFGWSVGRVYVSVRVYVKGVWVRVEGGKRRM